jgi:energy-coupling factor transporter transmembrane protein EcfT
VVERAEQLALAMTLRGYRPGAPRGFAREYRLGPGDAFLTGVGLLGFAFLGIL